MSEYFGISTLQALRQVRHLLSKEESWLKNAYARNEAGKEVPSSGSSAVCFCLTGAINHVSGPNGSLRRNVVRIIRSVLPERFRESIIGYNDSPDVSHRDLLSLIDRVITDVEERSETAKAT